MRPKPNPNPVSYGDRFHEPDRPLLAIRPIVSVISIVA